MMTNQARPSGGAVATMMTHGERRESERFRIDCPVTVSLLGQRRKRQLEPGRLHDIGVGGARLLLGEALEVGTRLLFNAHFPSPTHGVSTVSFEGVVLRANRKLLGEVAMRFRRGGRFLRKDLGQLVTGAGRPSGREGLASKVGTIP